VSWSKYRRAFGDAPLLRYGSDSVGEQGLELVGGTVRPIRASSLPRVDAVVFTHDDGRGIEAS
jgi:hypothetical protein